MKAHAEAIKTFYADKAAAVAAYRQTVLTGFQEVEDSLATVAKDVNEELEARLLTNKLGEGPRAPKAVWTPATDELDPAAPETVSPGGPTLTEIAGLAVATTTVSSGAGLAARVDRARAT